MVAHQLPNKRVALKGNGSLWCWWLLKGHTAPQHQDNSSISNPYLHITVDKKRHPITKLPLLHWPVHEKSRAMSFAFVKITLLVLIELLGASKRQNDGIGHMFLLLSLNNYSIQGGCRGVTSASAEVCRSTGQPINPKQARLALPEQIQHRTLRVIHTRPPSPPHYALPWT